jgi:NTE family protein
MVSPSNKALVLSGGSLKGSFQVGALKAVIESGFRPDHIYGISVGSLNGLFIVNEAGRQNTTADKLDWNLIISNLIDFWIQNLRKPSDIVKRKNTATLAFETLQGKFSGLVDTSPLHNLIRESVSMDNVFNSPISLKVGVVNIADGNITYANPSYPNFIDYVLASTAIPIIMPVVNIGRAPEKAFLDGSMRDVAPLKQAFESKAEEIVCIACQAKNLHSVTFNYGNIVSMADRVLDVLLNEGINTDIERAEMLNYFLPENGSPCKTGPYMGYKRTKLTIIRPPVPISIDLLNFTADDIQSLIKTGYRVAQEILNKHA